MMIVTKMKIKMILIITKKIEEAKEEVVEEGIEVEEEELRTAVPDKEAAADMDEMPEEREILWT